MKRTISACVLSITATLVVAATALAQMPKPVTQSVTVTATVEAIDKANRLVTLKGEKGNVVVVQADQTIKRFDELKVGDKISATYYESVAVNVRKPGMDAPKPGGAAVSRSPESMGGTAAVQDTVTVVVQSIDKANQAVTVKKQDGGVVSMRVQNPQYLESVNVGDTVDITYTRALLLRAEPAK